MCGINGIFAYLNSASPIDREEVQRTRDYMAARGPDGQGLWVSPNGRLGFGHRRLSIIDPSDAGAQPMLSADGQLVITFNGEIYNYRALRARLESAGHTFRSQSDTEILLHLYAEFGEAMLQELRGMFAFAIWDAKRARLFLARDPYGIKPLYYSVDAGTLRFASSVKALQAGGRLSRQPDPAGLIGFYLLGSVPEPFTIYRDVKCLPAGTMMLADAHGVDEPRSYFSLHEAYRLAEQQAAETPQTDLEERFRHALLDSVRHHLVADVPVGAFLSAGVDSGALVGLMRDAGQVDIQTITLAFDEFRGTLADEAPLSEVTARHYETRHTTRWIGAAEFLSDLPKIVDAMDQPSIDGINTWFVSKAARELGLKVALSGVGGDELLGSYSTFQSIPRRVRQLRLLTGLSGLSAGLGQAVRLARSMHLPIHPKAAGVLTHGATYPGAYLLQRGLYLPSELTDAIADEDLVRDGLARLQPTALIGRLLENGPTSAFGKVATLESGLYLRNQLLRDTDWAGMAHSLEIRTPLVDHVLLGQIAPMLVHQKQPIGKGLLGRAPSRALPAEIQARCKSGFGIPVKSWADHSPDRLGQTRPAVAAQDRLWSRDWACRIGSMQLPSAA